MGQAGGPSSEYGSKMRLEGQQLGGVAQDVADKPEYRREACCGIHAQSKRLLARYGIAD